VSLKTFIEVLETAGLDANRDSILDALWLASLDRTLSSSLQPPPLVPPERDAPYSDPTPGPPEPRSKPPEPGPRPPEPGPPDPVKVDLYNKGDVSAADITVPASGVLLPSARALPERLPLMRALRPLCRRWPSVYGVELNETRTAELTAELRLAVGNGVFPVLGPRLERWYEAHLVIEDDAAIELWSAPLREFAQLLRDTGAFRLVRTWRLRLDSAEPTNLARAQLETPAGGLSSARVLAGDSRRLFFFASHGDSVHWANGLHARLLKSWTSGSIALLHLLPRRRWAHTMLGEPHGLVRAVQPGSTTAALEVEPFWWRFGPDANEPRVVRLPAVPIEPASLENWARMQMGLGRGSEAFLLDPSETLSDDEATHLASDRINPELALTNLSERSSVAFDLAMMLASAPFTLPVARLVQEVTQKGSSDFSVLAELMLSGLVVAHSGEINVTRETTYYAIRESIRPLLLRSLRGADATALAEALNQRISDHLGAIAGRTVHFSALIENSGGTEKLPTWAQAFAHFTKALEDRGRRILNRPWRPVLETLSSAVLGQLARLSAAEIPLSHETVRADLWRYVDDPRFIELSTTNELRFQPDVAVYLKSILAKAPFFGLRILWVDETPGKNASIAAQLERGGAEPIVQASATVGALYHPALPDFDIIVSDMARDFNYRAGYDLLKGLQARRISAPVIIFSRSTMTSQGRRAQVISAGAFGGTNRSDELLQLVEEAAKTAVLNRYPSHSDAPDTTDFRESIDANIPQSWRVVDIPEGQFCSSGEIAREVQLSGRVERDETIVDQLLIFATHRQHTWLVATERSLVFVLDDAETRKEQRLVQRVMELTHALPVSASIGVDGAATVGFGRGELPRWYYSPTLFTSPRALEASVTSLIVNSLSRPAQQMLNGPDELVGTPTDALAAITREQVRHALVEAGIESADNVALDIILEAARFRPAPGFAAEISLTRLFCGAVVVGDRLPNEVSNCEKLRAFALTLRTPTWQHLRNGILAQFVQGGLGEANSRLALGFSENTRRAFKVASESNNVSGQLTGDSIVTLLLDPKSTYLSSMLYNALPNVVELRRDINSFRNDRPLENGDQHI